MTIFKNVAGSIQLNKGYMPDDTEKSQALSKQAGTPMFIDKEEITMKNGAIPKPKAVTDDAHRHEGTAKRRKITSDDQLDRY